MDTTNSLDGLTLDEVDARGDVCPVRNGAGEVPT